jgi:hypothetical protein
MRVILLQLQLQLQKNNQFRDVIKKASFHLKGGFLTGSDFDVALNQLGTLPSTPLT